MLLRLRGFLCFVFLRFLSNMLYWNCLHKYERKSQIDILPRIHAGDSRTSRFGFLFATTKQEGRGR